jgi:hypothetical protein
MAEEKVEVSINGLSRLQSAADDFARVESARIAQAVIEDLRSCPAEGVFEQTHARHFWDEYCWSLQEGPFPISGAFDSLLHAHIHAEVEKLPKYAQVFLSALAVEEDPDTDDEEFLGCIWVDGIAKLVTEAVKERACHRSLYLIGPNRADAIRYEIEGIGFVWSMLDRKEAMDLVSGHVHTMIDPDADLSSLADEMVEAFLTAAREDEGGAFFQALVDHCESKLRWIIMEEDVLPALREMRTKLLKAWDR